ncbi:type II toxin-antitoxin system ParD family antitoxin [Neorhizobium sp. DT-125]|uniref:type II toxin-antitoxin system ParD family antitoxin n=1 Tax=Neorhizobium sp. DT-125 TaxID=3396163 RepID=UPI003F1D0D62
MSPAHTVSLTKEQQDLVDRLVRSGRFEGANDVVASGLRLLEEREREASRFIAGLEAEIEKGLRSGDAVPMEPAGELLAAFRRRK